MKKKFLAKRSLLAVALAMSLVVSSVTAVPAEEMVTTAAEETSDGTGMENPEAQSSDDGSRGDASAYASGTNDSGEDDSVWESYDESQSSDTGISDNGSAEPKISEDDSPEAAADDSSEDCTEDTSEIDIDGITSGNICITEGLVDINPEYADFITVDDLVQTPEAEASDLAAVLAGESTDSTYYTSMADVVAALRCEMVKRTETTSVSYATTDENYSSQEYRSEKWTEIIQEARKHTGVYYEGDYLNKMYTGATGYVSEGELSGTYYVTFTYTCTYYTTAEQEAVFASAVDSAFSEMGISGMTSDYEKIKAIYQYICSHVVYDEVHVNDTSYLIQYTAYAALIDGTCVCQGFATLFYYMSLKAGVDARYISGDLPAGRHAWNIVRLNGLYYNLDSTWDESCDNDVEKYSYFLKCNAEFTDHPRDAEFNTDSFNASYPMASESYSESSEEPSTDTITWSMDSNGVVTISGTGAMETYAKGQSPWYANSSVTKVVVGEGITGIGSYAFCNCANLTSVELSSTVKKIGDYAFSGCSALTTVSSLEDTSLSYIGKSAFYSCTSWGETILLPDTITSIGNAAFLNTPVRDILIPDVDVTIGTSILASGSTIYGYSGSTAETYADNNSSYTFLSLHPDAVTNLKAEMVDQTSIEISWDAVKGAKWYIIYRAEDDETVYYGQVRTTGTSYTDENLTTGILYKYLVVPQNQFLDTWYSGEQASPVGCTLKAISITAQPANTTVIAGEKFTFSISAQGTGLSYLWQYSDDNGKTWTDTTRTVNNYSTYSKLTMDGRMFRCVVTDESGSSVTSDAATLTVKSAIEITSQTDSQTVNVGELYKFRVTAVSNNGSKLTYLWQYSKTLKGWTDTTRTVNNYGTYATVGVDGKYFRCRITDEAGNVVYSTPAMVRVLSDITITAQPTNTTVANGKRFYFTVTATGASLTYLWQYSADGGKTWINTSRTKNNYTTYAKPAMSGRMFRCVITDSSNNTVISEAGTLTVK